MTIAVGWLTDLNDLAASLEQRLRNEVRGSGAAPHRSLLVVGLPRSGTTLAVQVLAAAGGFAYVDNVMARYWRAPLVGYLMSRELGRTQADNAFQSSFGRTSDPFSPNEFNYFWRRYLGYDDNVQREHVEHERFTELGSVLDDLTRLAGRPFLSKAALTLFHIEPLATALPSARFVVVERDPIDIAASLAVMRRRLHGTEAAWTSLLPRGFDGRSADPPEGQIMWQVEQLRSFLERGLTNLGPERCLRVRYEELCASPRVVAHRAYALAGAGRARLDDIPPAFDVRSYDEAERRRFRGAST